MRRRALRPALAHPLARAALVATGCLVAAPLAVPGVADAPAAAHAAHAASGEPAPAGADGPAARRDDVRPRHSSDGVRGEIAPPRSTFARMRVRTTGEATWTVAPGVSVTKWTQTDRRGPIRAQLLTMAWDQPGVRLDYLAPPTVSDTDTVGDMVRSRGALAGVNGDFFDIGDTGAPLGVGKRQGRQLRHAPRAGWTASFYLDAAGVPRIGHLPMVATVREHPRWPMTNLNSPTIPEHGIGIYTRAWGTAPSRTVVGGGPAKTRAILVRRNRVVARYRTLPVGKPIRGRLLVGRGKGATKLMSKQVGSRLHVSYRLEQRVRTAISGNKILLADGVLNVVDDREMHPRTAVGIDYDSREILMLVVDGRSSESRGYTMVELATMMMDLGADSALNLDGGGSSTLVAPSRNGNLKAINEPSDGRQRSVANGLGVFVSR